MSDDIASLGLAIDSRPAAAASTALDKLASSASSAGDAADKLSAATGKSETMIRAIQSMADRAGVSFGVMNDRVNEASASINSSATATTKAAAATNTHSAALDKAATSAKNSSSELNGLDKIAGVLESRMLGLGSNLGFFGQILQVTGSGGLAAAAGIGAVAVVIDQLVSSAERMGAFAQQLQNISNVAGISTTSLQALQNEAVGFGVSADQTGQFLENFTKQLQGVRQGSGTLYTQLLKIDPALAAQLSTTKDTTTALNLLAQAYTKAGSSQNALASAAGGGRNAGQVGLLLGDIASKGGVDGVTSSVNQLDLITTKQTTHWAELKTQIDDAASSAKNNIASIFTGPVLEAEKSFFDGFLDFSRSAKEFALSDDFKTLVQIIQLTHSMSNALTVPTRTKVSANKPDFQSDFGANFNPSHAAEGPPAPLGANGQPLGSIQFQAQQAATAVSFLGSAATASDKYNAAVLKLNATVADNKDLTDLQSRAMAGLALDKNIAQVTLYNSALGDFATTQDLVTAKTLSLAKAQQQGAGLSSTQIANIKLETAANNDWSRATQSAQLGVFDLATAQKTANDQLQVAAGKKLIDPTNMEQYAAATQAAANKVQALADAAKVAGSAFPQLAQLSVSIGDVNKQFDAMATTSFNAVAPALEGILNGTTTLSAGFKNLGLSIVTAIEDAIIKLTIVKPLIDGLTSSLGGGSILSFLGLGGATGAVNANGSIAGAVGPTSVGGNPLVFASGGYTGDGGMFEPAGIVHKGEFVMNAAATSRIGVGNLTRLQGYAGGGYVTGGNNGGGGNTHVTVGVSVDNDGNLQAYVKNVSQQTTATGVSAFVKSPQFVDHVGKAAQAAKSQRKL